jgi:formate hydrogenlyase subunit 4
MNMICIIIKLACIAAVAPLVGGIISKIKNTLRMRQGPGVLQPYYNLAKLMAKEEVRSENASWIFVLTPWVVLVSSLVALCVVPVALPRCSAYLMGDFLLVFFVLGLGRFFLALAGLDTGSAFGGMGSSREMFISGFAEPAAILAAFAAGFGRGSTSLGAIAQGQMVTFSSVLAGVALFLVALAETSRIPIDNQETHLELTMVHEAMVLEYSGPSLALLEMAGYIRQMIFFSLITVVVLPPAAALFPAAGAMAPVLALGIYGAAVALLSATVAVVEVSVAKMRLFRTVDFLAFAFIISGMAVVASIVGV